MKLFSQAEELKEKVVYAGLWSFILQGTGQLFSLVRLLVVARLLSPQDIGLFALTSLILVSIDTLSKTGFQSALIHLEGSIQHYLNVAWTVQVLRGFIKAGFLFLIAPVAANFFDEPAVKSLFRIVAVAMICHGITNSGVIYFRKELEFYKFFIFTVSKLLTDLVVSITAAIYLRNALALVYGLVAGYVIQVIVSFKIHPFRPRFSFDFIALRRLIRYGIWVNFTGIMIFIGIHGAGIFVGKVISVYALGFYQLAHWITQSTIAEVADSLGTVAFSAYSKIQRDQKRFKTVFIKMAGFTLSLSIPVAVGIVLTSDVFVRIFLGDKWSEMIQPLRLLAAAACFHAIALSGRPVFLGIGHPRSLFHMQSIRAIIMLIIIYPLATRKGITGAAGAMIISNLAMLIFWNIRVRKLLRLKLKDFGQLIGPSMIATAIISAIFILLSFFSKQLYWSAHVELKVLWFISLLIVCFITYVITLRLIQPLFPDNQPLKALEVFFRK